MSSLKEVGFDLHKVKLSSKDIQELTNYFFSKFVKDNLDKATGTKLKIDAIADLAAVRDFITPISKDNFNNLQIKNFAVHFMECSDKSDFRYKPYNLVEDKHQGDVMRIPVEYHSSLAPCNVPVDKLTSNLQDLVHEGIQRFSSSNFEVLSGDSSQETYTAQSTDQTTNAEPIALTLKSYFDYWFN